MFGDSKDFRGQRTGKTHAKRQGTLLASLQLDNDHTVGQRGKDGTLVLHTITGIAGGVQCRTDIQFTAIVRDILVSQIQLHATHWQETHTMRATEEILIDNLMGRLFLTGKDAVAHLLQVCLGGRAVVVMG